LPGRAEGQQRLRLAQVVGGAYSHVIVPSVVMLPAVLVTSALGALIV
jgi:hypothetical protein